MLRVALKLSLFLGAAALTACSLTPIQLPYNDAMAPASDRAAASNPDAATKGDAGAVSDAPLSKRDAAKPDRSGELGTAPPGDGRLGDGLKPKDGLKPAHDGKKPPSADK